MANRNLTQDKENSGKHGVFPALVAASAGEVLWVVSPEAGKLFSARSGPRHRSLLDKHACEHICVSSIPSSPSCPWFPLLWLSLMRLSCWLSVFLHQRGRKMHGFNHWGELSLKLLQICAASQGQYWWNQLFGLEL